MWRNKAAFMITRPTWRFKADVLALLPLSLFLMALIVSGRSDKAELSFSGDERKAADIIEARGYSIISAAGQSESYELSKEKLNQPPYMTIWSVQETEPDPYIGKMIASYSFVVSGHPLEQMYTASADHSSEYEIHINVLLSDGEVIGGYSYPIKKDNVALMGGVYSLDGKTQEELTGLTYSEWFAQWKNKYSE
jgi:hypothetical protein